MRIGMLLTWIVVCAAVVGLPPAKAQDVEKARAKNVHLKLYPREADRYVNVYVEFDEPTDFTLYIPGTDRNNPKSWSINAKSAYQHSMDVTQLPDGEYTITLQYNGDQETDTFVVKR